MNKALKNYAKMLRSYDIDVVLTSNHAKIVKDGKTIASTPKTGEINCYRQSVRDLVRAGHLPESCKRQKF